ncbi:MAG: DUF3810 domain-containing protein [Flavisolibacter sp.]
MLKSLLRDRLLLILLGLSIAVKLFSLNAGWVERYYTHGFYPYFSSTLRFLLGWIPFSVGDLLYLGGFIFLVWKTWKYLRLLVKRQVKEYLSWVLFRKFVRLVLWIYLVFNIFWGLNYNRQGIAQQLSLDVKRYDKKELLQLTWLLQNRLNDYAAQVDTVKRMDWQKSGKLFQQGKRDFDLASRRYHFLEYQKPAIKPSLFSVVGHYFGFSGYFNPFSGEAQLNMAEPVYVKPFVLNHEIAHQLGYAKENEASFVSFLAGKHSDQADFRYSLYYELYYNAFAEVVMTKDSLTIQSFRNKLHPRARLDRAEEIRFRSKRKNRVQPYVSDFYDSYLKMNNQPGGLTTYNEVTSWLIAFMKKYGTTTL